MKNCLPKIGESDFLSNAQGAEANPSLIGVCIIAQANKASAHQETMDWNQTPYQDCQYLVDASMNRCNEAFYNADETAMWPYVLRHGPNSYTW